MNGVLDQLGVGKVVVFGHDCALDLSCHVGRGLRG